MAKTRSRWNLGSYSRFIKAARQREGLTLPQARSLYRRIRSRTDSPVFASHLKGRLKGIAHEQAERIKEGKTLDLGPPIGYGDSGSMFSGGHGGSPKPISSISQWEEEYERYDPEDYEEDYDDYEGTAEYGETT